MGDFNSQKNRVVWVDIPVADLDRAKNFYAAVLGCGVEKMATPDFDFCVIDHEDGNGGCLVHAPDEVSDSRGIMVYFNVDGRIHDAVAQAETHGGSVMQATHGIGPHGFRAVVRDSEGNRIVLHSNSHA